MPMNESISDVFWYNAWCSDKGEDFMTAVMGQVDMMSADEKLRLNYEEMKEIV